MTGKIWAWDMPTKFVLCVLTADQKWHCVFIPPDWLICPKADGFFKKYCNWWWNICDPETRQWKTSLSPWSKKVNWVHCKTHVTLTAAAASPPLFVFFFSSLFFLTLDGIFAPQMYTSQGETVNQYFHVQVLRHICDVVCHEPWKLQCCAWHIHHNTLVRQTKLCDNFLPNTTFPRYSVPIHPFHGTTFSPLPWLRTCWKGKDFKIF